jgi:hypothetical protein
MSTQTSVNAFFLPTQISGCQLWLDGADRNSVVLSGSNVTQWRDKSGQGRNAIVSSNAFATYSGNPLGLRFSNSFYTTTYTADPTNETSFTVFNYIDGHPNIIIVGASSGGREIAIFNTVNDIGIIKALIAWGPTTPITSNAIQMATAVLTSGVSSSISANGGAPTVGSAITFNSGGNTVLGRENAANPLPFGGFLYETIFYNFVLSTSQRQQVEGYLAWKWGLQSSLPATHPYKNSPIPPLLNPPTTLPVLLQNLTATFTPTQISGCSLWLDAADSTTLSLSSSSVTQWRDKSSNAFTATGVVAPTYNATTRYILFNGSSQYFTLPNGAFPTGNTPYSMFFVAYTNNSANPQWIIAGGTESTNQAIGAIFFTTNAIWHSWWANEYRVDNSISNGVPAILNLSYSTTRTTIVNGGTATTNSPGASRNNAAGPNFIGRRIDPSQYLNGGLGEILMFSSEIPTSQRQQVEGYLAWKWNLQASLPANHPYKAGPPYSATISAPSRSILQTASWNPTRISSCTCWLDASDPSSQTVSGTTVSQWRDKALSRAFNGSGTRAVANSYACVRMNGSQGMTSATNFTFAEVCTNAANMICFMILNVSSSTNGNSSAFSLNVAQPRFIPFYNGSGGVFFDAGNQADPRLGGSFTNNVRQMHVFLRSGITTLQFRLNGSTNASFTFTNPANYGNQSYTGFLSPSGAGGSFIGDIHEIVYYSNEIGLANIQQVEGYLAWKWGLQRSLPANHPWVNWPPPP